ncbi:MAG: 16S rRNA (guanine(527)-N(7))-methyltransferase RsmG [Rhodothermales bacterium]
MRPSLRHPFDNLTTEQRDQLTAYREQVLRFNRRINLVSRDTAAQFEDRHVRHALTLAYKAFPAGSRVVDWGTGGGLPAVPLAIYFPDVTFYAVDAVEKKIQCVRMMARRLGLQNLHPWHGRAEAWPGTARYSVSRATAPLLDLWRWHTRSREAVLQEGVADQWQPGLICLKGGDLREEINALQQQYPTVRVETIRLDTLLEPPYFVNKVILEVWEA